MASSYAFPASDSGPDQRAKIEDADEKQRDMFDQGKGQRATLGIEADFPGKRFTKKIKRRHFAPDEAQRFEIKQLHVRDEAEQASQSDGEREAENRHKATALSIKVSGRCRIRRAIAARLAPFRRGRARDPYR